MSRAIVSRQTLDRLIQLRLAEMAECAGASPMPVQWTRHGRKGCNREMPGFIGSIAAVKACQGALQSYLDLLHGAFDLPKES